MENGSVGDNVSMGSDFRADLYSEIISKFVNRKRVFVVE